VRANLFAKRAPMAKPLFGKANGERGLITLSTHGAERSNAVYASVAPYCAPLDVGEDIR